MKNKNHILLGLFLILVLIQLAIPLSMIAKREQVLKTGQIFKFITEPVDPYDVFRGRYVALQIQKNRLKNPLSLGLKPQQNVYVHLKTDVQGFAYPTYLERTSPLKGDYIKVTIADITGDDILLKYPFDRYYMEEKMAPRAEDAYRSQNAYVTVRILNGEAVLENLFIEKTPIYEYLLKHQK